MTYSSFRQRRDGGVRKTHVSENDGRDDGIMVTHTDIVLELAILFPEGLCAGVKLGLAEGRHGSIADGGGRDTDGCWDGGGQEGVEGVVTEPGEHEGGLIVVRADVPVGEGVKGVEERGRGLGRRETPYVKLGVLQDGGEAGKSESRCGAQGCHGRG